MEEPQPTEKVPLTTFQKFLEALCLILFVVSILWFLFIWDTIPREIPTHFNLMGEADDWGSKSNLIILPVIHIFLYFFITILSRFPQIWNHPWVVTSNNRLTIYQNLYSLILFCKVTLVCTFGYISITAAQSLSLGTWFSWFSLGGLLLPICFFLIKINKEVKRIARTSNENL